MKTKKQFLMTLLFLAVMIGSMGMMNTATAVQTGLWDEDRDKGLQAPGGIF